MQGFLAELKRRNVVRVGIVYLAAAWLILQVVNNVTPALRLPDWVASLTVVVLAIGLPLALVLSWLFEQTADGFKLTAEVDATSSLAPQTARKLDRILIGVLATLVVVLVGERLFAPSSGSAVGAAAVQTAATVPANAAPSIAVLPFADMSPDKDQEYFSDGLSEELLNRLASFRGLRVIGRTSSFSFKGRNEDLRTIGETLGVNHVLEGSVRKSGNQLRITAQLIDPADGSHRWSRTYERDLSDVFVIQDDIARAVTEALAVTLGVANENIEGWTRSVEAYDEYLLGRSAATDLTEDGIGRAVEHLQRAVEIDPQYVDAWSALAVYYSVGAQMGGQRTLEWREKAVEITERLQTLAPGSVGAALALSRELRNGGDWLGAEKALQRGRVQTVSGIVDLDLEIGRLLLAVGRVRESVAFLENAQRNDPLSGLPNLFLAEAYANSGKFTDAFALFDKGRNLRGAEQLIVGSALLTALATRDLEEIVKRADDVVRFEPNAGALNGELARYAGDPEQMRAAVQRLWSNPANRAGFRVSAFVLLNSGVRRTSCITGRHTANIAIRFPSSRSPASAVSVSPA